MACHTSWNIVDLTTRNKYQWNFNQNAYIFIYKKYFEYSVGEIEAILSWPHSVNGSEGRQVEKEKVLISL